MTTTREYDSTNHLKRVATARASGAVVVSFGSAYNAANQRTNTVTGPEGAQWRYGYDALGQVTNAWRYWRDGTRVPGQQFAYAFDQIGNRRTAWSGDPASGLSAVPYQTDIVNQYTVRTNRQAVDIMGLAHAAARVTLNGPATTRKGEYYYRSYPTTNSTTASWQRMTITATLTNAGATTNIGWALMPRAQEVMSHDLDGNLTQDGLWTYTWDAENRLARMQSSQMSSNCGAPVMALDFAYDAGGRRTAKTVSCWTNGGWMVVSKLRFVYDGWNLVAELNATNNGVIRSYAWGTDASGSMQGAGGVGGLLWATRSSDSSTHFTCYDGNHNVMALVNAATGETSAQYEYGPFHELLRATGPMARENVFLAATKYQDWESGFYYYGYRYYSPSTGRWLSRDPIGEQISDEGAAEPNLYCFVGNESVRGYDFLGLASRCNNDTDCLRCLLFHEGRGLESACLKALKNTIANRAKAKGRGICAEAMSGGYSGAKKESGNYSKCCNQKWCPDRTTNSKGKKVAPYNPDKEDAKKIDDFLTKNPELTSSDESTVMFHASSIDKPDSWGSEYEEVTVPGCTQIKFYRKVTKRTRATM